MRTETNGTTEQRTQRTDGLTDQRTDGLNGLNGPTDSTYISSFASSSGSISLKQIQQSRSSSTSALLQWFVSSYGHATMVPIKR